MGNRKPRRGLILVEKPQSKIYNPRIGFIISNIFIFTAGWERYNL